LREQSAGRHNDPYLGGARSGDDTILVPVFADGEHPLTAGANAHQADCGDALATTYGMGGVRAAPSSAARTGASTRRP
jgi:N-methylhydantoinase B